MSTGPERRGLFLIDGEIKTPPFSAEARKEAGRHLRLLQDGEPLGMPHSRPMPSIGAGCHELRVRDETVNWRIFYRLDVDQVLVIGVFAKKTGKTPRRVIELCRKRLRDFDGR